VRCRRKEGELNARSLARVMSLDLNPVLLDSAGKVCVVGMPWVSGLVVPSGSGVALSGGASPLTSLEGCDRSADGAILRDAAQAARLLLRMTERVCGFGVFHPRIKNDWR